jgi:branched-chain amino acid transport system substrate-binding protein
VASLALSVIAFAFGAPLSASAATSSSNKSTIKIAMISSLTGAAAAQFSTAATGFQARIAAQNAAGGVNGHKIQGIVIDDQTSPTTVVTAVKQAIADGVVGIVSVTPLFFLAAKYAQQAGIPVTGGAFDGSEWGTQPYTNMFPSDTTPTDPTWPVSTSTGAIFKQYGGKVVGTYGYGISPSSTDATYATAKSSLAAGLKVGVLDVSVPFGSESFSTQALAAKSAGVNALTAQMDVNSNIALLTALKQNGVNPKVTVFATGYQDSLPASSSWSTLQGSYFSTAFRPWSLPATSGITAQKAAFKKYGHYTAKDFPAYNDNESYLGADLMILGLQKAGANPTSAGVIKALRSTTAYNGGGILPLTLNYSTNFGYNVKQSCGWLMKVQTKAFVAVSQQPGCYPFIPGSSGKTPPSS